MEKYEEHSSKPGCSGKSLHSMREAEWLQWDQRRGLEMKLTFQPAPGNELEKEYDGATIAE